ncbi:GNAT family N-acetyltransferase [Stackebrandtia albiflava]|nr:GNAT family N-acetyltransferase [Stackebrandtia albiflava]
MTADTLRLRPWSESDLPILIAANSPEMTGFLGGPESHAKLLSRHRRYLSMTDRRSGVMFRVENTTGMPVGSVGYWEKVWRDGTVYETGWAILPEFQGRGLATVAVTEMLAELRPVAVREWLHAFPAVEHVASNAVCRKAGFTLLGPVEFEYPPGSTLTSNDWRLRLSET